LNDVAPYIPGLGKIIEELAARYLFSRKALERDVVRECSVRSLSAILVLALDAECRGNSAEAKRILSRFVDGTPDVFVIQWLGGQFSCQTPSALAAAGYLVDHLREFADLILNKDESEEAEARRALTTVIRSNWLGAVCERPLTVVGVQAFIRRVLGILATTDRAWQVQTVLLLLTEAFLAGLFFYLDDAILENLIDDRIVPGLHHHHPDVQDAAAQLLTFIVRCSKTFTEKLLQLVDTFKRMLVDREVLARRIAGAKGLSAIITGTVLFDDVPEYVFDSFTALSDALEIDSSLEQVITQFLADFWADHDNNLAPDVVNVLAPFHAQLAAPYYS
jgi:hypothetical protein